MTDVFIGIDPGITGAIAFIETLYETAAKTHTEATVFDFADPESLAQLQKVKGLQCFAFLEKAQAMRRGGVKQGTVSTGKFMHAAGIAEGYLRALGIPFAIKTKREWWPLVKDSSSTGKDAKVVSLDLARRLFPYFSTTKLRRKKDHNRAEALLIAEACRRFQCSLK